MTSRPLNGAPVEDVWSYDLIYPPIRAANFYVGRQDGL
jgi:hypothetical protein